MGTSSLTANEQLASQLNAVPIGISHLNDLTEVNDVDGAASAVLQIRILSSPAIGGT